VKAFIVRAVFLDSPAFPRYIIKEIMGVSAGADVPSFVFGVKHRLPL
jgi:hypothetical protein